MSVPAVRTRRAVTAVACGRTLGAAATASSGPGTYHRGWQEWHTLARKVFQYHDYTLNDNGRLTRYGSKPTDYLTDVLTAKAVR